MSGPDGRGFNQDRLPTAEYDVNGNRIAPENVQPGQKGGTLPSAADELVQHRGMEGAQADEIVWNSGSDN